MNLDFYKNKKIFITGHTGFKGSWLCLMLNQLKAKITGYALEKNSDDQSLFDLAKIEQKLDSNIADIRDYKKLKQILHQANPEIIFHLASQSLVLDSYQDPIYNYQTNVMGLVNLFEACKDLKSVKAIVNITSDKCYENKEWHWPYRESDRLGGHDPYSASKACSEIISSSYYQSFFDKLNIGLATARAGNVIGGGDFSKNRIIPDLIRSIKNDQHLTLRNPEAVRPWQYVLDVLQGYLLLAKNLYNQPKEFSQSFNFSPINNIEITVEELTKKFILAIGKGKYQITTSSLNPHESTTLKLDASKANRMLNWYPKFSSDQAISITAIWYKNYLEKKEIGNFCENELAYFNQKK
jgi:CDP-glucose 4,6-dehydratase